MLEFLIFIGLLGISISIIQDFKSREIANWLNFSILIFALAFRAFYGVFFNNYMFFIFGIAGVGMTFILGHILYYGRLFAGGDAKLLISLGAILPLDDNFYDNFLIIVIFIIALLLGGAIYSLIYSIILSIKNKKSFVKNYKKLYIENIDYFYGILAFSSVFIIYSLVSYDFIFLIFPLFAIGLFFLYIYTKSVEQSCMIVEKKYEELSPGDWIIDEIKINGIMIKPNWEGLTKNEVDLLKKHRKKIRIKDGIPFTPAFLIAFLVVTYIYYFLNGDWGFWKFNF